MRMRTGVALPLALAVAVIAPFGASSSLAAATATPRPTYGVTWVADTAANSLTEYASGVRGAADPIATIIGANTHLAQPTGVTVDPAGNIYASNAGSNSLTEYALRANGNVAPIATISGAATALDGPASVTYIDDKLWVANPASNLVEAFSIGVNGNVLPALTYSGAKTRLNHPVAVSETGDDFGVWVVNAPTSGTPSLTSYDTTRSGNTAPDDRIAGSKTGLVAPDAIVADGFSFVWVADRATNTVSQFADDGPQPANHAPGTTITGVNTGLDEPTGISLDALDQIAVANAGNHSVRLFGTHAEFDATPLRSITGIGSDAGAPDAVDLFSAPPGAPTHIHVVAGSGRATLTWRSPVQTGGGVLGYQVLAFPDTGGDEELYSFATSNNYPYSTKKTSYTQRFLTNGVRYQFIVNTINTQGQSFSRHLPTATPIGNAGAPRGLTVVPDQNAIKVFWGTPAHDGGKPITHYRVQYATCSPGASGCAFRTRVTAAKVRHLTITGLRGGTTYRIRVLAETSHGLGKASRTAAVRAA
jgi:hypothetical protein